MLPRDWNWKDADVFKKASAEFNVWGADLRQRKIRFGFHNHNYEFKTFDGRTGFDIIVESTDPKLVCFELDCYWLTQSGNDPVAVIRKLGDRVRLLHLKDRKPGFPATQVLDDDAMHFTEVGSGTIDWKAVIEVAKEVGVEHLVVERDNGDLPPLKSASISFRNLQKLL
jgi:sugar phosphate isomerase/epimerase